jgi:sulfoxide reductase heme-binding subunit YedZ
MASQRAFADHAWWLASRASGVVALVLVTSSVALGLVMGGKLAGRPGANQTLFAIHEQVAVTALVAVAIHGVTLLGDSWLNPGPGGIALPFTMAYRPLWTGFGIIAGWLAALLGLSFYARRMIGARLWRRAHRLTIVVFGLAVAHTLGAGTDATTLWLYLSVVGVSGSVALLFGVRVGSSLRRSRRRRAAAAQRERESGRSSPPPAEPQLETADATS